MQIGKRNNFGFTLIELIVVIIIIAIIAGFSAMSYSKIAKGMRISSATNTVIASLDNARALAIRNNRYVMTVFRPRLTRDGSNQLIEVVIAEWRGDSSNAAKEPGGDIWTYDRFVPIAGLKIRTLPLGVNIAAPSSQSSDDDEWLVPTYLPDIRNIPSSDAAHLVGRVSGVLYSPEGRVVSRNAISASDRTWVDFNSDGEQTWDPDPDRDISTDDPWNVGWLNNQPPAIVVIHDPEGDVPASVYGCLLKGPGGEPFIMPIDIITVFDEDAFREIHSPADWGGWQDRIKFYTEYISQRAEPIQFNRYSGVPLK